MAQLAARQGNRFEVRIAQEVPTVILDPVRITGPGSEKPLEEDRRHVQACQKDAEKDRDCLAQALAAADHENRLGRNLAMARC